MAKAAGIDITWTNWFVAALVPGLLSIILIPLILYFVYPPEVKHHPHATRFAKNKLKEMGPMSAREWIMVGVFIFMLFLSFVISCMPPRISAGKASCRYILCQQPAYHIGIQ